MSELEIRLQNNGAFRRCGKVFCAVHGIELNVDGSCSECLKTEAIIATDRAEARAMNISQQILENDDFFERC